MLWKLDALQAFIRELHWPEEVFADHLDHRLKLMAADMIEATAKRYCYMRLTCRVFSIVVILECFLKLIITYVYLFYFSSRIIKVAFTKYVEQNR